jgi:hypothetical protein
LPGVLWAASKAHPIEGTVTALGTYQQEGAVRSLNRTYTVKTPTRVFVLQCPYAMTGIHIHSPSECGGKNKIQIGDAIHFRTEKNYAYLQIDNGKEQKLNVLSESVSDTGNLQAPKP